MLFSGTSGDGLALDARTDFGEAAIRAVLPHQLVVRAGLYDAPVVHHENLIGMADRRQPVGNGDDRLAARQRFNRLLNQVPRFPGRCLPSPRRG